MFYILNGSFYPVISPIIVSSVIINIQNSTEELQIVFHCISSQENGCQ